MHRVQHLMLRFLITIFLNLIKIINQMLQNINIREIEKFYFI